MPTRPSSTSLVSSTGSAGVSIGVSSAGVEVSKGVEDSLFLLFLSFLDFLEEVGAHASAISA